MYINRSTPFETLHSILLGPCKYLVKKLISSLSPQYKKELLARMNVFNNSGIFIVKILCLKLYIKYIGIEGKVMGNICYYHKSFVGRDFKAWMQMVIFLIHPYLNQSELHVWLCLSKVGKVFNCMTCSSCQHAIGFPIDLRDTFLSK